MADRPAIPSLEECAPPATPGDEATATKILRATRRLVSDDGTFKFSMRQIATSAGISLRTLYEQYSSKDDLVLAVYRQAIQTFAAEVVPVVELCRTPEEKLRFLVNLTVLKARSHSASDAILREHNYLATVRPRAVHEIQTPFRELVLSIMDLVPSLPAEPDQRELLADLALTSMMALHHSHSHGMIKASGQDLADTLTAYIARGLGFST